MLLLARVRWRWQAFRASSAIIETVGVSHPAGSPRIAPTRRQGVLRGEPDRLAQGVRTTRDMSHSSSICSHYRQWLPLSATILALATLLGGCQSASRGIGGGATARQRAEHVPVRSQIATISTIDEETIYAFDLPEHAEIRAGTFFRVLDPERDELSKGTLQVLEITPDDQALARLVGGLFDEERPIASGDPIREMALGGLISGEEAERRARAEIADEAQADERDERQFERLRQDYQRKLSAMRSEFNEEIERLQETHADSIALLERRHARALESKETERRADLAALKTRLDQDFAKRLQAADRKHAERERQLAAEKRQLQNRVDELLALQRKHNAQVERLLAEQAAAKREYQAALRAEAETREVLEARLQEVEGILSERDPSADEVLTNDPGRPETILERLGRVVAQRQRLENRAAIQQQRIEALEQEVTTLRAGRTRQEDRVALLQEQLSTTQSMLKESQSALAQSRQQIDDLQNTAENLDAIELARLNAERNYFSLLARILRMDNDQRALKGLKTDVQAMLDEARTPAPAGPGAAGTDTAEARREEP